ncbi:AraC family transcriptional regulator [Rhizobium terrae]|uniref:AraC family transcriptional regulator n=1 Tax=Rhizobium terrae TaxID=2171756 RepID=UPI000E3CC9E9|nr:AraC family transcriptional regulator [Rhizobium terrae]
MRTNGRHGFTILRTRMAGVQAVVACSDRHFARHTHDQFGIGVIEAGAQTSLSGRGQVEAGPGDVITVNPGEVHDGVPIGGNARFWRMLYLDPQVVAQAVADIRQGLPGDFEFCDPVMTTAPSAATMRRLFAAVTSAEADADMRGGELLLTLLAEVMRAAPAAKAAPAGVRSARERIDDDPAAPVDLAELAGLAGLSRFQLLRAFDRATGLTPHAYLIQRRIQLARKLIAGGVSLAEAALASGFADQSHMTRIFTRSYGLSPRLYAEAVR